MFLGRCFDLSSWSSFDIPVEEYILKRDSIFVGWLCDGWIICTDVTLIGTLMMMWREENCDYSGGSIEWRMVL